MCITMNPISSKHTFISLTRRVYTDFIYSSPYWIGNDRIILQPHMGGLTDVSWKRAYIEALENVRSFFEIGNAISPVNADAVQQQK